MLAYSEPTVSESIGRVIYEWKKLELRVRADRITDEGTAELWFYHTNGKGDSLLHAGKVNLLSTTAMSSLAKRMTQSSENVPWQQVLTCISSKTLEYARRGEPGVIINPTVNEVVHPGYFVEPIVMRGVPNVIYGDKGTNKTTMCLTIMGLIQLGNGEESCGLIAHRKSTNVAMLDWESNRDLTDYTLSRLIKGETIPWFPMPYLRCKQSLADDVDRIGNFLSDNKVEVVLIDSLGQAAGSDRFDTAGKNTALKFFEALRQFNLTSLIIGQNSKGEDGQKKKLYGSVYYIYYSRNIFELKGKQDELDENQMHVAFFHEEANYSKKYQPMGFNISFTDSTIKIESEPVSMSQFLEKASQTNELLDFLKKGAQSVKSISDALDVSDNRARVMLSRAKKRNLVTALGSGMWGLATET